MSSSLHFKRVRAVSANEVDVYIYGNIGYDWWEGVNNTATRFVRDFKDLELSYQRINVHINSVGGTLYDGLPIYNCLRYSPREVHTYVDGCAMSMAGVIALGGSTVHAYRSSILMLHSPHMCACGNARDFRGYAEYLDKLGATFLSPVCAKTGKDNNTIAKEVFDYDDHYFTPEEALAYGLVDVIEDAEAVFPEGVDGGNLQGMDAEALSAAYRKAYAVRRESGGFFHKVAAKVLSPKIETTKFSNDMNTNKLTTLLGLPQNANEEQILAAISNRSGHAAAATVTPGAPAVPVATPATPAAPAATSAAPAAPATPAAPAAPAATPATPVATPVATPAAAPAAPAASITLGVEEYKALKAAADKVAGIEARLTAIENSAAAAGGGAPAAGDFAAAPTGDEAIRASFMGGRKSIFD